MTIDSRPRIALTLGDPAGVGPELAARLLANPENLKKASVFVLADRSELDAAAATAGVEIPLSDTPHEGFAVLLDDGTAPVEPIVPKQVSKAAGERAKHQLLRAVELVNKGEIDGIVFTPLNKASMHYAGMSEQDELRWFAKLLGFEGTTSELNVMPGLWTSRVTSHVSVSEIAKHITIENEVAAIKLLHTVLRESGIENPRLGVAALNPHAGESGLFGREEIDVIAPAVAKAAESGIDVKGPFPSDTIFLARENYDGIVTQYHDQGQIAFKLLGFEGGVTVQGGLPVTIATPAHGTAFDIVGTGQATIASSQNAFDIVVNTAIGRRAARSAADQVKPCCSSAVPPSEHAE